MMTNMTPIILPIFLPFVGCQNRCLFCNQKATAAEIPSLSSIGESIASSLTRLFSENNSRERQVAFYGGSFTALNRDDQILYLKEVQPLLASETIHSIRVSTRPDAMDEETLSFLKANGVKTIEIGAQSMIDEVLFLSRRGHRAEDTVSAVSRLRRWDFEIGIHLMIGLPGDTCDRFLQTLDQVIALKPDFVRVHPTLVLEGSGLEALWRAGQYFPLSLDEAVRWLKKGLLRLENSNIRVARIGLQPTRELERHLLAGPYHPALHQIIDSAIFLDMAKHLLEICPEKSEACFLCHPKEVSNLRGQRNENIVRLRKSFGLKEIVIRNTEDVPAGSLILRTSSNNFSIQRRNLWYSEY
jgi:histone acetyltransferase (RNA polymerase elongator complex component)